MTAYPRLSTMPQEKKRSPFRGLSPCAHSRLAALGPALGAAARGRRAVAGYGLWTTEITVPHQSSYTTPGDASLSTQTARSLPEWPLEAPSSTNSSLPARKYG